MILQCRNPDFKNGQIIMNKLFLARAKSINMCHYLALDRSFVMRDWRFTVNDKSPCHHLNDTVPRPCESAVCYAVSGVTVWSR